jgi:hypothetical protein
MGTRISVVGTDPVVDAPGVTSLLAPGSTSPDRCQRGPSALEHPPGKTGTVTGER